MLGHTAPPVRVAGEVEVLQHHCIFDPLGSFNSTSSGTGSCLSGLLCPVAIWCVVKLDRSNPGCRTASKHRRGVEDLSEICRPKRQSFTEEQVILILTRYIMS